MIGTHMIIAVIGSSTARGYLADIAEEVGRELASRGVKVVCGGLGGVMEAVCRGAKSGGGTTIGVLPGSGYARNVIVVKTGEAVIAIGGAFGTLSEIGHALADGIPVVGLGTWTVSQSGIPADSIQVAADPADAVDRAMAAAGARAHGTTATAEDLRG